MAKNKMYILVNAELEPGKAINSACHAAVACTLKYQDHPSTKFWLDNTFYKVTCRATIKEMEKCMEKAEDFVIIQEVTLPWMEIAAVAFRPRDEYHKCFDFLKLFK